MRKKISKNLARPYDGTDRLNIKPCDALLIYRSRLWEAEPSIFFSHICQIPVLEFAQTAHNTACSVLQSRALVELDGHIEKTNFALVAVQK